MTSDEYKQKAVQRFLANVLIKPGCWTWTGPVNAHGYGRFFYEGKNRKAPRVAYELMVGTIPKSNYSVHGTMILHTCDNPRCVNPLHLRLGDAKSNMEDAKAKGRLRGNGQNKLDPDKVRRIRALLESGESTKAIAAEFGVHGTLVSQIRKGKVWRSVQ